MTAAWALTLPQAPSADGFRVVYPSVVVRSSMDAGPTKQRRRVAWAKKTMVAPFVMSPTQLTDFEEFYKNTVRAGTDVFEWTDPMRDVLGEYRIIEDPQIEADEYGLWYRVTIVLEHVRDLS